MSVQTRGMLVIYVPHDMWCKIYGLQSHYGLPISTTTVRSKDCSKYTSVNTVLLYKVLVEQDFATALWGNDVIAILQIGNTVNSTSMARL